MTAEYKKANQKESTTELNIVLLPDDATSQTLVTWSERVAHRYPTVFKLNQTDKLPHLSLYSAKYPSENQDQIEEQVRTIAASTSPVDIILQGFSIFSGFLFYDALKSDKLLKLHEQLVSALNPLREGLISDTQRQLTNLTDEQQKAIEIYGYVSVGRLYMPHVTVTKMVNPQVAKQAIALLPKETHIFQAKEIAIAPFASHGTCPKPLLTIPLL